MADGDASLAVLGGRVCVGTKKLGGTVRFVGPVAFAEGTWVGLEIDVPLGKNNGTVKGVEYFNCADLHGLFLRPSALFAEVSTPLNVIAEDVLQTDQVEHPKPRGTESSAQAVQKEGKVEQKEKEQGLQAKQSQGSAEASNSSMQDAPASESGSPRSPPKKLQKAGNKAIAAKRLAPAKAASKAKVESTSTAEESSARITPQSEESVSAGSAPLIVADQRSNEVKREDTKESRGAIVSKPIEREGKLTNDSNVVTEASANCAVLSEDQQQAMLERMEERFRSRLAESREQLQMDQEKFEDRVRKLEIWSNGLHQSDDSQQISKLNTMESRLSTLEQRADSLHDTAQSAQDSSKRAEERNEMPHADLQQVLGGFRQRLDDFAAKVSSEGESSQYDGRRDEEAPKSESRLSAIEKRLQDCESFHANSNPSVRTQFELEENRSPEGHMEYDFGSLGKRIDVQSSALHEYIAESREALLLVQAQIESCKVKTQNFDEMAGRQSTQSNPELIPHSEKEKDDVSKLDSERLQEIVSNLQEGVADCAAGMHSVRARVDAYHDELQNQSLKTQVSQQKLETRLAKRIDMSLPTPHFLGGGGDEKMETQQTLEGMPQLEAHIDERVGALAANLLTVLPSENLLKQTQKLLEQMPKLEARVDACEKLSLSKRTAWPTTERSPAPLASSGFNPFTLLCV